MGRSVTAGLVGGDMDALDRSEHELHKASDIRLRDVWEDVPSGTPQAPKPFQKDVTYGRARGNTWGYQSKRKAYFSLANQPLRLYYFTVIS